MDLNKVAVRFKRAWANAGRALNVKLPEVVSVTQSRFPNEYDVSVVFDQHVTTYVDTFTEIGCLVDRLEQNVADLKLPTNLMSAPTRLAFAFNEVDRLHNALLDAGVSDWLDIRLTTDEKALEVEFLEHPTAEQIAALKVGYDVLTFEELTYTFVERTSGQTAPLVDPAKVEAKVRQCWAGGHGGKIAALEAQTDPREWIVTTVKSVPANANLRNHGLALVKQIAPEVSHVRVMDELWAKLLQKPTSATTDTTEAATVADGDTEPLANPEPAPDAVPLPELDERDLEINALKAQVESLQEIVRALTPVSDEWQTVRLVVERDTAITRHPKIAEQEALGWNIHSTHFATNGQDVLFVLMHRRGATKHTPLEMNGYVSRVTPSAYGNGNGRAGRVENMIVGGSDTLLDVMIRDMNAELASSANALRNAFYQTGMFNGN